MVDKACLDCIFSSDSSRLKPPIEPWKKLLGISTEGIFCSFHMSDVQSSISTLQERSGLNGWFVKPAYSTGIDNDISYNVFIATKWNEEERHAK